MWEYHYAALVGTGGKGLPFHYLWPGHQGALALSSPNLAGHSSQARGRYSPGVTGAGGLQLPLQTLGYYSRRHPNQGRHLPSGVGGKEGVGLGCLILQGSSSLQAGPKMQYLEGRCKEMRIILKCSEASAISLPKIIKWHISNYLPILYLS